MENRKILVVDDESDMQVYVSTVVETMGFEPFVAGDGPGVAGNIVSAAATGLIPAKAVIERTG